VLRVCDVTGIESEKKDLVFKKALQKALRVDYKHTSSPEFAEKIYRIFSDISGEKDPYKKIRKTQNDLILDHIDFFRQEIEKSTDPLRTAAVYSLMGNIIDYGTASLFDPGTLFQQYENIHPTIDDYPEFVRRLTDGGTVLIIADNAGEAVFDLLFIEEIRKLYPDSIIFYGVRSAPAINDVLAEDARYIGIDKVATVVETGSTLAGTIVAKSTAEFRRIYDRANIVISKGQGNFETLEQENKDILFALKVKCEVVARYTNLEYGSLLFAFNSTLKG
jgi:uncharacterized protein with ATP-grasp and redox domains